MQKYKTKCNSAHIFFYFLLCITNTTEGLWDKVPLLTWIKLSYMSLLRKGRFIVILNANQIIDKMKQLLHSIFKDLEVKNVPIRKRQSLQEVVLGKIGQLRVKIEIRAFLHIIYKKKFKID